MFRGRFQLGDEVQLTVRCLTASDVPGTAATLTRQPVAILCKAGDTQPAVCLRLPICDRYEIDGVFHHPLVLDHRFSAGFWTVHYQWEISSVPGSLTENFEIIAGGHGDGHGLSMYHFERLGSNFVLLQTASRRLLRRRNPRLV